MALLHARAFAAMSRAWSADEFARLRADPVVFAITRDRGFVLGRAAGGEAEVLTLAVAPECRRRGIGRGLLAAFEREAGARGAETALLEVAVSNLGARALYARAGYAEAGIRRGYLRDPQGGRVDALVLRKTLGSRPAPRGDANTI